MPVWGWVLLIAGPSPLPHDVAASEELTARELDAEEKRETRVR